MSYFGIDLGTTNSCLAYYDTDRRQAVVVTNAKEGAQTLPSIVAFDPGVPGEAIVGRAARDVMDYSPSTGVEFVKRYMGENDVYPLTTPDGRRLTPQDVSAFILKQIKAYGEAATGEVIDEVVVTVPAYFGWAERQATEFAVSAAGMKLKALIDEPTAAALSYFENYTGTDPLTVMVYDLGGGTFDVSVVRLMFNPDGTQRVEVVTYDGDHRLGGVDWDNRLFELLREKVEEELTARGSELVGTPQEELEIRKRTEDIKKRLSETTSATLRLSIGSDRVNVTVTREEFEQATADLLERTRALCEGVLAHPRMARVNVDRVLLVGGSSLMPMVQEMVKKIMPGADVALADPHLAVGKGACIANYMGFSSGDDMVMGGNGTTIAPVESVIPRSIGFGLLDREKETLYIEQRIIRGTPMKQGHLLVTIDDYCNAYANAPSVIIAAFEVSRETSRKRIDVEWTDAPTFHVVNPDNNPYGVRYLGELELPMEPNSPAGTPLRLKIDATTTHLRMECFNRSTNGRHFSVTLKMVDEADISGFTLEDDVE